MSGSAKDHFHISVSLVVQLVDDFTNQVLGGSGIVLEVEGQKKPIRKADGFFVFTNISEQELLLKISAALYQEERYRIDMNALSPDRLVKLRLKPSRSYGLPKGTTCLEGTVEPYKQIFAYLPKGKEFYKLMFDAKKRRGTEEPLIQIYNPEKHDLEERYLMLVNEEEKKEELIHVLHLKDADTGVCQIEKTLKNSYKKIGTRLFPVMTATADEHGYFFLPLKQLGEPELECVLMDEANIRRNVVLEKGRINHIHYPA